MFDAKIVAACVADRKAYDKVRAHVDPQEFTPTGRFWWKLVDQWYGNDPSASAVDAQLLRERGTREAGHNSGMALDWFGALPTPPSPENVAWEVLELKRVIKWRELAAAMESEWNRDDIARLVNEHQELMQATSLQKRSEIEWAVDLDDLSAAVDRSKGIRLWPEALHARTGGALPGEHIVVFGRPESGKTLFASNITAGWLRDGHKVLYIGNEDNINLITDRIRCNLSGMTREQIQQHTSEANSRCRRKGWNNLHAVHLFPGSATEISELVEEVRPSCLVLDQLRNIRSAEARGGTKAQKHDSTAQDIRQLLAKYRLVGLSIGQANAGEHGKPKMWLDMDDYDESRTGVPGSADLMVGVGTTPELEAHGQRALSLPKNKMSGNHDGFVVNIDKHRSRIQ